MKRIIIAAILVIALMGCQQQDAEEVAISSPFIGGTQGLEISFQEFRSNVFAGGDDPFDIIVQVENEGENAVQRQNGQIEISGINPTEFGKTSAQLRKTLPDDMMEIRKTPEGQTLEPAPIFVEFTGLNYQQNIAGATATFPIRAEICYMYETTAITQLCVREKLLSPETGGICEVTGTKPVFNSGAPVQISNVQQTVRSKDKIGLSFDISNAGGGKIYERGSTCEKARPKENKVYLTVNTGLPGIQCTGLQASGGVAQGYVTLYGGSKTISCTQRAETSTDFKQIVTINAVYDYEEIAETTLTVKSSGEE